MQWRSIIKALISASLLGALVLVVDLRKLVDTFLDISPLALVILTAGYLTGQLLSATKWWLIVRSGGFQSPWLRAVKAYFTGMFVNVLGIGTVGGDMTRALLVTDGTATKPAALASVVADRAHGLAVLASIGAMAAALFGHHQLPDSFVWMLFALGAAVPVGWFLLPLVVRKVLPRRMIFRETVEVMLGVFPRDRQTVIAITLLSALVHCLQISLYQIMAWGLDLHIPWRLLFLAVPFSNIVSTLPISWQGLGIRENALRFFFVPSILTNEQAIAFGTMWIFAVTVSGAIGGLVGTILGEAGKTPTASELLKPKT